MADPVYSTRQLLFGGRKMEWLNLHEIVDTFKANPTHFNQTETNLVNGYRSTVNNSKVIDEVVSAPYVRRHQVFQRSPASDRRRALRTHER